MSDTGQFNISDTKGVAVDVSTVSGKGALKVDVVQTVSTGGPAITTPVRLSDGAAFYDATKTGQLPAALDGSGYLKTHEQGTIPVTGTFWQATQPVSATALPLPTGAATEATQASLATVPGVDAHAVTGTMAMAIASETIEHYLDNEARALSLTQDGRLRVSAVPAVALTVDFYGTEPGLLSDANPWEMVNPYV